MWEALSYAAGVVAFCAIVALFIALIALLSSDDYSGDTSHLKAMKWSLILFVAAGVTAFLAGIAAMSL